VRAGPARVKAGAACDPHKSLWMWHSRHQSYSCRRFEVPTLVGGLYRTLSILATAV